MRDANHNVPKLGTESALSSLEARLLPITCVFIVLLHRTPYSIDVCKCGKNWPDAAATPVKYEHDIQIANMYLDDVEKLGK